MEMGKILKSIIRVLDEQGEVVEDAQITVLISDPTSKPIAVIPAQFGDGRVYRTDAWPVPHKMQAGKWSISVEAKSGLGNGDTSTTFLVTDSISETLWRKYGFWVDSPGLKGMVPYLVKEQGDAQNGAITWGGVVPAQHIFPESWLEIQWREGDFDLTTAENVRKFMLDTLGNPGFYPTRNLESFERSEFKHWDAWKVKVRGQLSRYDIEWLIFFAPEFSKTYALGTTVVLPPEGIDAHTVLKEGFEIYPNIQADGIAPQPLPDMLPPVELIDPALGMQFLGTGHPITLKWSAAKELADDEYYQVSIDYNYEESNPTANFATREIQFVLPESYYHLPNCGVFNWRVTLMRQTGIGEDGQPEGEPLSYNSFYWYIKWRYPPGEEAPFKALCPNAQF